MLEYPEKRSHSLYIWRIGYSLEISNNGYLLGIVIFLDLCIIQRIKNSMKKKSMKKYTDYIVGKTEELLNIDSPSGYTENAAARITPSISIRSTAATWKRP